MTIQFCNHFREMLDTTHIQSISFRPSCSQIIMSIPVAGSRISQTGSANPSFFSKNLLFGKIFADNLHENERNCVASQSDWLLHVSGLGGRCGHTAHTPQSDWLLHVSCLKEVWMPQSDWLLHVSGLGRCGHTV